jgi:hypothetical protein
VFIFIITNYFNFFKMNFFIILNCFDVIILKKIY